MYTNFPASRPCAAGLQSSSSCRRCQPAYAPRENWGWVSRRCCRLISRHLRQPDRLSWLSPTGSSGFLHGHNFDRSTRALSLPTRRFSESLMFSISPVNDPPSTFAPVAQDQTQDSTAGDAEAPSL